MVCEPNEIVPCYCPDSYKICVNGYFWSECRDDHSECDGESCVCVEGNGDDECTANSDCLTGDYSTKPLVYSLTGDNGSYCTGIQGTGIAYLSWIYLDPNEKNQSQYEIQIDDNSDFSSPEVDRIVYYTNLGSSSYQQQLVLVKQTPTTAGCDYITYNTEYYWRVQVKNSSGVSSDWTYHNGAIGTINSSLQNSYTYGYAHPAPTPAYTYSPTNPVAGKDVDFLDLSICYNETNSYYCNENTITTTCYDGLCYTWNFGDGGFNSNPISNPPTNNVIGNTSHQYTQTRNNMTSLRVCDDISCCTARKNIQLRTYGSQEIPTWKEVSPF